MVVYSSVLAIFAGLVVVWALGAHRRSVSRVMDHMQYGLKLTVGLVVLVVEVAIHAHALQEAFTFFEANLRL